MAMIHNRRSIRLKGYDYARAGAYYVTICTQGRLRRFGEIAQEMMVANAMGAVVQRCWDAIPEHMPFVLVDAFVVMPNHLHGIIVITDRVVTDHWPNGAVGAGNFPPLPHPDTTSSPPDGTDQTRPRTMPMMQKNSLGHIVQTFKAGVSRHAVRDGLMSSGNAIWQRGYFERIIRDDAEHARIARYIQDNPANWNNDRFNR